MEKNRTSSTSESIVPVTEMTEEEVIEYEVKKITLMRIQRDWTKNEVTPEIEQEIYDFALSMDELSKALKEYAQQNGEIDWLRQLLFLLHTLSDEDGKNISDFIALVRADIEPNALTAATECFYAMIFKSMTPTRSDNRVFETMKDVLLTAENELNLGDISDAPVDMFEVLINERVVEAFAARREDYVLAHG